MNKSIRYLLIYTNQDMPLSAKESREYMLELVSFNLLRFRINLSKKIF